jgi:hypothetical protein
LFIGIKHAANIITRPSKLRLVEAQDAEVARERGAVGEAGDERDEVREGAEEVRGPGFQMGDRVHVHSLEKATRHNGKAGVLVEYAFEAGRWLVALDPWVSGFRGSGFGVRGSGLGRV